MPEATDKALLRQFAKTRSEQAFSELVRRNMDLVYSAALRQANGVVPQAEDVTQQVFILLAHKAKSLIDHPALTGWLYLAASHASKRASRSEWRRVAREQKLFAMNSPLSPPNSLDWEQTRPVLDAALQRLGETDRDALLQRYFARKSFPEIGRALQVTEDGARRRVERALEKLRSHLAKHGITSSAAALALSLESQSVAAAPAGLVAKVSAAAFHAPHAGLVQILMSLKLPLALGIATIATASLLLRAETANAALKLEIATLQSEKRDTEHALTNLQVENQHLAESMARNAAFAAVGSKPRIRKASSDQSASEMIKGLILKGADVRTAFRAYQDFTGHRVIPDPDVEHAQGALWITLGPCPTAVAAQAIRDELLVHAHIVLEPLSDGTVHAHLSH